MAIYPIHDAKRNLGRLIERAEAGEEVIIVRGKTRVARLVPIGKVSRKRLPGLLKGRLRVGPEFFQPLPDDELMFEN
ncbi:MAG: type II toxin-antitoxin system prevent-host-death family antitoxin [Candidatus Acidiferrum sp.]